MRKMTWLATAAIGLILGTTGAQAHRNLPYDAPGAQIDRQAPAKSTVNKSEEFMQFAGNSSTNSSSNSSNNSSSNSSNNSSSNSSNNSSSNSNSNSSSKSRGNGWNWW